MHYLIGYNNATSFYEVMDNSVGLITVIVVKNRYILYEGFVVVVVIYC